MKGVRAVQPETPNQLLILDVGHRDESRGILKKCNKYSRITGTAWIN